VKEISLPSLIQIEVDKPTEIQVEDVKELMEPVRENRFQILTCAAAIEALWEAAIQIYLFQGSSARAKSDFFREHILLTSWFSLEAKRQLMEEIVRQSEIETEQWRKAYLERLREVVRYRNTFTHGTFSTDGETIVLRWFSGGPQRKLLSDDWLTKIETSLRECFDMSQQLNKALAPDNFRRAD
jgi:hypothetical protein